MLALPRSRLPLDIALVDQLRIDKSAVTRMPNQLCTWWNRRLYMPVVVKWFSKIPSERQN